MAVESHPTSAQWAAPAASLAAELEPLARGALSLSQEHPIALVGPGGRVYLFTSEWGTPAARVLVGAQGDLALSALPAPPLLVVLRPHPAGMRGVRMSTEYVRAAIARDRNNRFLVPWVRRVIQAANLPDPRGYPNPANVVAALFAAQKSEMAFVKDPVGGEMMATASSLLCLDPNGFCLLGGDCDDQLIVLGASVMSAGIPVRLLVRRYPRMAQAHIVLQYDADPLAGGAWTCIDPSTDTGACSSAPYAEQLIVEILGNVQQEGGHFLGLGAPDPSSALDLVDEVDEQGTLGAPGDVLAPDVAQGWLDQLQGAQNALVRARARLSQNAAAYDAVRADLGLAPTDPSPAPSEALSPGPLAAYVQTGAFTSEAAAARSRLLATADFLAQAIGEGLAGKRALTFANGDLYVAAAPGDPYGVILGQSPSGAPVPMFVDPGGQTTGTLGILPILVGAIVLGSVVVSLAATWAVSKYCDYLASTHHDDALNKIATEQQQLVASGKSTPEQMTATVKALTDLDKANPTKPSAIGDVLAAFPVVALIGAGLAGAAAGFGLSRFVSSLGWFAGGQRSGARREVASSPRRRGYRRARASAVQYIVDLAAPDWSEEIRPHKDGSATLFRNLRPIYRFRPSPSQWRKIRSRQGKISIDDRQYVPFPDR
jgi:hypothetical protein